MRCDHYGSGGSGGSGSGSGSGSEHRSSAQLGPGRRAAHSRDGHKVAVSITNRYRTSLLATRSYASLIWPASISSISAPSW